MMPARAAAVVVVAVMATLAAPALAAATPVVNGDFEADGLKGWNVSRETGAGGWFRYSGTEPPIGKHRNNAAPLQAPPQGSGAATSDEANPDSLILWQDVTLDPGVAQQLNLLAYYNSYRPLAIPAPETLAVADEALGGQSNQQYRIDLMRPSSPLGSVAPVDVLTTVFATHAGGPETMVPTWFTADLTPFAGQTVRLRIANAVTEEVFNAGVDAVSITTGKGGDPGIAGRFSIRSVRSLRGKGIVLLSVRCPGPGRLRVHGKGAASLKRDVAGAGTVSLRLKPTRQARNRLRRSHRLRVKLALSFTPAGGQMQKTNRIVYFKDS